MKGSNRNVTARLMETVARKSVKAAGDSRCMYLFHQPKQPDGIRKFKK